MELLSRDQQGKAALGERMVTLSAQCESPQVIGIPYTSTSETGSGSPVRVGQLHVVDAQLDGKPVALVFTTNPGTVLEALTNGDRIQPQSLEAGKSLIIQLRLNAEASTASAGDNGSGSWESTSVFRLFTP